MNRHLSFLPLIMLFSCSSSVKQHEKESYEDQICSCLETKAKQLNFDLDKEYDYFEKQLISSKIIENNQVPSYLTIIDSLSQSENVLSRIRYSSKNLDLIGPTSFFKCVKPFLKDKEFWNSEAKIAEMMNYFLQVYQNKSPETTLLFEFYKKTLSEEDFQHKFYRLMILDNLYNAARNYHFENARIKLDLYEDSFIVLEENMVTLEDLPSRLKDIKQNLFDQGYNEHIITLSIENGVKMGLVSEIKEYLKKDTTNKIQYQKQE